MCVCVCVCTERVLPVGWQLSQVYHDNRMSVSADGHTPTCTHTYTRMHASMCEHTLSALQLIDVTVTVDRQVEKPQGALICDSYYRQNELVK